MYCRHIQYIIILVFVQSRRVHLFIVNCLLKNKFNIHVTYYLYLSQHYKPNFQAKNIILLKFTINYSLFKPYYNWQYCSALSLTVVILCVCTKRECVCDNKVVCKAVLLAFHARPVPFPFPLFLFPDSNWESLVLLHIKHWWEVIHLTYKYTKKKSFLAGTWMTIHAIRTIVVSRFKKKNIYKTFDQTMILRITLEINILL